MVDFFVDGKFVVVKKCHKFSNIKKLRWNHKTKSAGVLMLD